MVASEILYECIGVSAPYYNLALVVIVILLFIKLIRIPSKEAYHTPWKILFIAVSIYVVEEVMTVLSNAKIIAFPHIIFGFFEMAMITLFIYTVLLQKEYIKEKLVK